MIYSAKDFGSHCTVEIVAYSHDGYPKTTVYADNIVEAMDLAEEFYKLNDAVVEVCEMENERWKLSYMIEPYRGWVKDTNDAEASQAEQWLEGLEFVY